MRRVSLDVGVLLLTLGRGRSLIHLGLNQAGRVERVVSLLLLRKILSMRLVVDPAVLEQDLGV